jgi:hypothetical protein
VQEAEKKNLCRQVEVGRQQRDNAFDPVTALEFDPPDFSYYSTFLLGRSGDLESLPKAPGQAGRVAQASMHECGCARIDALSFCEHRPLFVTQGEGFCGCARENLSEAFGYARSFAPKCLITRVIQPDGLRAMAQEGAERVFSLKGVTAACFAPPFC